MIKYLIIILLFSAAVYFNIFENTDAVIKDRTIPEVNNLPSFHLTDLRDTLYTLKPYFLVVNLAEQKGYLYSFYEATYEFGISSGNKKFLDAVEANEGLFVIQAKLLKWHSRQFDSTLMINWMGFNHGIGFHALAGNSYYKFLGVKKSSHGCVRISREDAKYIYQRVEPGTPVLVHSGNNAVFLGFADSSNINSYFEYSYTDLFNILPERYNKLYEGRYFIEHFKKLVIDKNNVKHDGLPVGDSEKIPERQLVLPGALDNYCAVKDVLKKQVTAGDVVQEQVLPKESFGQVQEYVQEKASLEN